MENSENKFMILYFIFLGLFQYVIPLHAQIDNNLDSISLEQRARLLNNYAEKIHIDTANKEKNHIQFFNLLPNNFKDFFKIYGSNFNNSNSSIKYDVIDINQKYTLYSFIDEIKKFINPREYYNKMINIGINGVSPRIGQPLEDNEVDGFQLHLYHIIYANIKLGVDALRIHSNEEIKSFWTFFYDTNRPDINQALYEDLYSKIEVFNPQIAELMRQAYEDSLLKMLGWP